MRGVYYEEETCWMTLLSFTVVGTAFIVGTLCCLMAVCLIMCCVCVKRCKRQKKLEILKRRGIVPNVNQALPAQVRPQQIVPQVPQQVQQSRPVPKCNCPKKHSVNTSTPTSLNNLSTSINDFGYQPPMISNVNKVVAQPQNVQMNMYPKFEEVEVKNPYPKFEFIAKSKINF
jgi:hypothetical protein